MNVSTSWPRFPFASAFILACQPSILSTGATDLNVHSPSLASTRSPRNIAGQARDRSKEDTNARRQRVKDITELRPRTDDEKQRALYFDRPGLPPILDTGSLVALSGGHQQPESDNPISVQRFLAEIVCASTAVVIGEGASPTARLNASETALFTDYRIKAQRWITPSSGLAEIVVSTYGGEVELPDGRVLRTVEGRHFDLTKSFLLFLTPVPNTSGFTLSSSPLLVELGNVVFAGSGYWLPKQLRQYPTSVVTTETLIRDSAKPCALEQK
jgi:hypothetical protein